MDKNATSSPLRILLVEDDEHDRLAFGRALDKGGLPADIAACERAEDALRRLRSDAGSFDLVVVDHKLPGMSGLDLCKTLLDEEISLPLVILTGKGSEDLAVEALKAGVDDYIVKAPGQAYSEVLAAILSEAVRKHENRCLARKRAEEAVRQTSEQLKSMLDRMPEALVIENRDHEIVWTNEAARQLLNIEVGQRSAIPAEMTEQIANGNRDIAIRKVNLQDKVLECKSCLANRAGEGTVLSILTDVTRLNELLQDMVSGVPGQHRADSGGGDVNVLSMLSDVSELEQIAAHWARVAEESEQRAAELQRANAELARRQEQREGELRQLEKLSAGSLSGVSAAFYGAAPLREAAPQVFDEAIQRYADLLDLALEEQAFKSDHGVSGELTALAEVLGAAGAGPRDLIDIHSSATKAKMRGAAAQKAQAYIEEGRLMVLKLMGNLASYYRNYSFGAGQTKAVSPAGDQGAVK